MHFSLLPHAGASHGGFVLDVSDGGARFRTRQFLPVHASFIVDLHPAGIGGVRAHGSVAWINGLPGDEGFEVGARLTGQSVAAQTFIADQVARNSP